MEPGYKEMGTIVKIKAKCKKLNILIINMFN
jgi:hypothetical protein